jgi:hypothetical protein
LKKILIISPHYPPSNLAAVHRTRLFAQHFPSFDWDPIILTVDEQYYEEQLDWNLHKLLPRHQRIEKVKAYSATKPRLIGDIGLRAFFQLYKKAKRIIQNEQINFLYIPIPSFYAALLGRRLHKTTGVKYGIDYIDPWVHIFPGSEKIFSRHWLSTQMAKLLEPIAVKHASLITGVSEGYYQGVMKRNPHLLKTCLFGAMPYGGEKNDHNKVKEIDVGSYLFKRIPGKIQLVYAGAFLPKSKDVIKRVFSHINQNRSLFSNLVIHFVGTGNLSNGSYRNVIKPIAEEFDLYDSIIREHPQRIPYLNVLSHLSEADGVFILGSTEPHYSPSKVYQAVLSKKPIFALLHNESPAVSIIRNSNAGIVLSFDGENNLDIVDHYLSESYSSFITFMNAYNDSQIKMNYFDQYSAKSVTHQLANLLNKICHT